ncbi:MAG: alpha/beta hydrolase [Erythrobacter sp.]|jgi:pimeloyl-ACP methyl ester carboxylesterase|nr:alpha/beta hydrolase [Erythrobacter sp.]
MLDRFSTALPSFDFAPIQDRRRELARRWELARGAYPEQEKGKPRLIRLLGEFDLLLEPFRRLFRKLDIPKTDNPKLVLIMPGFASGPYRMRYMARMLEKAGHRTKRWGMGFNWGADEELFERLEARLMGVCKRYRKDVVILGWSLGGLYGRELARLHPDCVSKVITLGSPFSGSLRANNVWRVYQAIAGHSVDQLPIETDLSAKPPVETVAMWSASDGAIAPRSAAGYPGERDRAVALRCTHTGFTYAPEAIHAVLDELERG